MAGKVAFAKVDCDAESKSVNIKLCYFLPGWK